MPGYCRTQFCCLEVPLCSPPRNVGAVAGPSLQLSPAAPRKGNSEASSLHLDFGTVRYWRSLAIAQVGLAEFPPPCPKPGSQLTCFDSRRTIFGKSCQNVYCQQFRCRWLPQFETLSNINSHIAETLCQYLIYQNQIVFNGSKIIF